MFETFDVVALFGRAFSMHKVAQSTEHALYFPPLKAVLQLIILSLDPLTAHNELLYRQTIQKDVLSIKYMYAHHQTC